MKYDLSGLWSRWGSSTVLNTLPLKHIRFSGYWAVTLHRSNDLSSDAFNQQEIGWMFGSRFIFIGCSAQLKAQTRTGTARGVNSGACLVIWWGGQRGQTEFSVRLASDALRWYFLSFWKMLQKYLFSLSAHTTSSKRILILEIQMKFMVESTPLLRPVAHEVYSPCHHQTLTDSRDRFVFVMYRKY